MALGFGSTQQNLFDPSDDPFFTVVGDRIEGSYLPANSSPAGTAAGSGPGSVVAVTTGGITINLLFDVAAMAAPASFRAGITQAAAMLAATISDHITVNLKIDYSGTGGGAAAGPDSGFFENYTTIRTDLINNATAGDTTFNALPGSIPGQTNVAVWNAQLKLWGFLGANDTTTDDGSATFATDINPNLLVGVALHELTHALGRVPYGPQPDIFDLFRFTSAGVRLFQGGATAPAAYFSIDGGVTKLADLGRTSDASDFLNSGVQGSTDPFNEFYNGSTSQVLSAVDKQMLDALGFHTSAPLPTTVIESQGSTHLTQVGNNYFLYDSTNTGPSLKYLGATITVGMWGGWAPIGGEKTATGYEVAWKLAGADQYTVWNTDNNGNDTTNTIGTVSGNSIALESLESSFQQDLNGDGVIGIPPTTITVIESSGSTSLTQVGNNYFLYVNGTSTGPEVKYSGAPLTVGEFAWTPIGAEQISGGYEIALKSAAGQYTIWITDSSGNVDYDPSGVLSASSAALETYETSFHQDLNGDGVIGIPAPVSPGVTPSPVSQPPAVTIASNDTFVFGRGGGVGDGGGNGGPAGQFGSAIAAGQLAALFHETPAGQPQVQPVHDAHDTVIDSGDHFGQMIADLHASAVFIH